MLYDLKYYIEASNKNVYHQVTQNGITKNN